ncbi:hypothetical protein [Thalassotalea profundi]|uniref:Uncharacterized protein n=1 Tax=Thalassotalea profundi TaxID=2036687 RepID=A0ABQ3IRD7_9GAMM|nr:hypothetical protein [Thalassotalea profundi]GHE90413.1 hypothetical protein GCM10011501_19760 [Thalassotalea profundi]
MFNSNSNNTILNNNLNSSYLENLNNKDQNKGFKHGHLRIIDVENDFNISQQYAEICQQYFVENKWVLMINPDTQPLDQLNKNIAIDTSKILKVYANKVTIVLANIESALCKGNCSAVVLCNPLLSDKEIEQLSECAQLSKTSCIVIRNNRRIH